LVPPCEKLVPVSCVQKRIATRSAVDPVLFTAAVELHPAASKSCRFPAPYISATPTGGVRPLLKPCFVDRLLPEFHLYRT
jgi:hypothetical protein